MEDLVVTLTVFVLAVFVGFEIITKIPPTLHTPLMSGSKAISNGTVNCIPPSTLAPQPMRTVRVVSTFGPTHQELCPFTRAHSPW